MSLSPPPHPQHTLASSIAFSPVSSSSVAFPYKFAYSIVFPYTPAYRVASHTCRHPVHVGIQNYFPINTCIRSCIPIHVSTQYYFPHTQQVEATPASSDTPSTIHTCIQSRSLTHTPASIITSLSLLHLLSLLSHTCLCPMSLVSWLHTCILGHLSAIHTHVHCHFYFPFTPTSTVTSISHTHLHLLSLLIPHTPAPSITLLSHK